MRIDVPKVSAHYRFFFAEIETLSHLSVSELYPYSANTSTVGIEVHVLIFAELHQIQVHVLISIRTYLCLNNEYKYSILYEKSCIFQQKSVKFSLK